MRIIAINNVRVPYPSPCIRASWLLVLELIHSVGSSLKHKHDEALLALFQVQNYQNVDNGAGAAAISSEQLYPSLFVMRWSFVGRWPIYPCFDASPLVVRSTLQTSEALFSRGEEQPL